VTSRDKIYLKNKLITVACGHAQVAQVTSATPRGGNGRDRWVRVGAWPKWQVRLQEAVAKDAG
jgi:hypothetical protein